MKTVIIILLIFLTVSCSPDLSSDELIINKLISDIDREKNMVDNGVILVLPSHGCQSCLDETIKFIKNNYKNKSLLCVVSGISMKELRIKFSDSIIDNYNVLADIEGIVYNNKIEKPTAFYFVNGKLNSKIELHSNEIDVFFDRLLEFIESK